MIQRIQSIYLFLTATLMAVTVFSPLILFTDGGKLEMMLRPFGIFNLGVNYPTWGVLTFAILGALLPFVNIFLFKNRKLQMKLGTFTSLIILFFYVTIAVYLNRFMDDMGANFVSIQYGIILPVLALVFNVLAILSIKKDEKKVRSLDRIR